MNERSPDLAPLAPLSRSSPPPRTAPPPFSRPSPSTPPPRPRLRLHPLAFVGLLAVALLVALAVLLVSRGETDELTEAEIEALVRAAPPAQPAAPAPTRWTAPTQPAALRLTTEPTGAAVYLDGEPVGRTPLALGDLRPAFYTVALRLPDHAPLDTAIYLASSSVFSLDVALAARSPDRTARVGSRPTDGMPIEPVPTMRQEPNRRPTERVDRQGGSSGGGTAPARSRPASVPAFESADPDVLRRVIHTGSLSVSSTPAGATVLVDGVPRGRAPVSLSGLSPGPYVVTLTMPGWTPVSYRADVTAQAVSVVNAIFPAK